MVGPKAIIHLDRLKSNLDLIRKQVNNKPIMAVVKANGYGHGGVASAKRSEEHTSELQSRTNLVCRLLLEKKKQPNNHHLSLAP